MDNIASKMPLRLVEGAATEEYFSQDDVWENLDGVAQGLDAPVWLTDPSDPSKVFGTTNCIGLASMVQQGYNVIGVGSTRLCYDCEPAIDTAARFALTEHKAARSIASRFILATS